MGIEKCHDVMVRKCINDDHTVKQQYMVSSDEYSAISSRICFIFHSFVGFYIGIEEEINADAKRECDRSIKNNYAS